MAVISSKHLHLCIYKMLNAFLQHSLEVKSAKVKSKSAMKIKSTTLALNYSQATEKPLNQSHFLCPKKQKYNPRPQC